jgi:hypothetical protein
MLKLPSKRWKQVRVKTGEQGNCILSFISSLQDEQELREIVAEDISECLNEADRIIGSDWETKSVTLEISDWETFKRRLIYVNIVIEE